MKKALIVLLAIVMSLALGSAVMAGKKGPQIPCPPTGLVEVAGDEDKHCFDWDPPDSECGKTPTKYSLDVELLLDGDGWDDIAELTFNTADRTDLGEATDTDLRALTRFLNTSIPMPIAETLFLNLLTTCEKSIGAPSSAPA